MTVADGAVAVSATVAPVAAPERPTGHRYRIRYSKLGRARFVGHLDLARILERTFRRASLTTLFSEGFTPHPKISFGLALPVGWESRAEYLDVSLVDAIGADEIAGRLNPVMPAGIAVEDVVSIEPGRQSLSSVVVRADYSVELARLVDGAWVPINPDKLNAELLAILGSQSLIAPRMRKGIEVEEDLRPLIFNLRVMNRANPAITCRDHLNGTSVEMTLATQSRVVRPEEIAALLSRRGLAAEAALVRREAQYANLNGELVEPMSQMLLGSKRAE